MEQTQLKQRDRQGGLFARLGDVEAGHLPILGKMPIERRYQTLIVGMIVSVVATVAFASLYVHQISKRASYVEIATSLQTQSQRYSKSAQQALIGDKGAFDLLKQSEAAFSEGLKTLAESAPVGTQAQLDEVSKAWKTASKDIDILIAQKDVLLGLGQAVQQINAEEPRLLRLAGQAGGKLDVLTLSMAKNANEMVASNTLEPEVVYQMSQDMSSFNDAVAASGNPALKDAYGKVSGPVDQILKALPRLIESKRAARELFDNSEKMLDRTTSLANSLKSGGSWLYLSLAVLFGLLALASMVLMALVNVAEARTRAEAAAREQESVARENRRNQEAILRLLNEMGDLAEGNLTVRATVTEDITGAIADSVNFAIEELRTLVGNVTRAVVQVTQATDEAKSTAQEVLDAADQQTSDIGHTTDSVNFMSESVSRVSENAAESARVAQQSLDYARKGGDSVRDSIAGMNAIRDQIQETSKRIKRLGESSQEIGEIVELISDITEQTNVLALNAAIQAAAAGEAGRGFSVVAEEVQRLAERSGQATRRIGAIVKTIQTDTQDTINAMEVSTRGVVEGAVLSDAAGHALQDIESVSADLARLIQSISDATREQADTATRIADNMQQILRQTRQAAGSSHKSADSISQLTLLADELRISVAGFTL